MLDPPKVKSRTIKEIDDIGKIWAKNEKNKRGTRSLKTKGIREFKSYQRNLNQLSKVVDESLHQIRKQMQQNKVNHVRYLAHTKSYPSTQHSLESIKQSLPLPKQTIDQYDDTNPEERVMNEQYLCDDS